MTRLETLSHLLSAAESARDEAQRDHRHSLASARAAQLQLEDLLSYRREYEKRFRERLSRPTGAELLQGYQAFMVRMCQAIEHQERVVQQTEALESRHRGQLMERETRVGAITRLLQRQAERLQVAQRRREQQLADEQAMRVIQAARTAGSSSPFEGFRR